eukprot:TRINITY_DN11209_c0_g1_i1.p1 TRINITY_DN11209_c0_g1~~TRINITY_DN11209_c0_g1_i1.p1  ORF type:complete len:964 (+),score=192.86 TRINITY_DN11209_c0_g1_i1:46-2937(+)
MSEVAKVQVAVRVRPTLKREVKEGQVVSCIGADSDKGKIYLGSKGAGPVVIDGSGKSSASITEYTYDRVLKETCTEDDVFRGSIEKSVQSTKEGYNVTIFAYGQSGSGKTHTITNLTSRILADLLEIHEDTNNQLTLSIMQLYNESLTDLADPQSPTLNIRYSEAAVVVDGLSEMPFSSVKEAVKIISSANNRRATGATNLNEVSSRSHLIIRVHLPGNRELNLVDLAGSERVSQSGAHGDRLREAAHINKSLFTLISVVKDLASGAAHIPYRNSKLTQLLRDGLGGDSKTVVIATVSPSLESVSETGNTLSFATACGNILNKPRRILSSRTPPPVRQKKPTKPTIPWKYSSDPPLYKRVTHKTAVGPVSVLQSARDRKPGEEVLVLMHGCPSEAAAMSNWFGVAEYCNMWAIAIDQRGYGSTPGTPHKSRSEHILDEDGPADLVMAVTRTLEITSAHFLGYDWGGGIALAIGLRHPLRVKSVISIMPSYGEVKKGELSKMKPKTLILWVSTDVMHNWKKWKPLAESIPNSTINCIKKVEDIGSKIDALSHGVVTFLTGTDPFKAAKSLGVAPVTKGKTTSGQSITVVNQVSLRSDLSESDMSKYKQKDSLYESVQQFLKLVGSDALLGDFKAAVTSRPASIYSINLPALSPDSIGDGTCLCDLGVWSPQTPKNKTILDKSPRYYPGRSILVKTNHINGNYKSESYMKYDGVSEEEFVTHFAVIKEVNHKSYKVEVQKASGGSVILDVDKQMVHELNQRHIFKQDEGTSHYHFEDGVRGNYEGAIAKVKIMEIAATIAPIVEKIDFASSNCLKYQMKCVEAIRGCLNTKTFAEGLDRNRIGRTDDVTKLACFGQVQCHGASSTMSFFLLPFCESLGIDIKYRGGYTFGPGHSPTIATVSNSVEAHQWLELTYRPSCETVTCDLFLNMINNSIESAYTDMMYPNGKLIIGTKSAAISMNDIHEG